MLDMGHSYTKEEKLSAVVNIPLGEKHDVTAMR